MDATEWLHQGLTLGFIRGFCGTHDYYMTDKEVDIETEHGEVCYTVYRLSTDMEPS
jgi:hypothetical protein